MSWIMMMMTVDNWSRRWNRRLLHCRHLRQVLMIIHFSLIKAQIKKYILCSNSNPIHLSRWKGFQLCWWRGSGLFGRSKKEKKKALRDVVRESRRTVLLLCFARMTSVRTNEMVDGRRSLWGTGRSSSILRDSLNETHATLQIFYTLKKSRRRGKKSDRRRDFGV